MEEGWLIREEGIIKLATAEPTCAQALLALQAHRIVLPRYDVVELAGHLFYLDTFYAAVFAEGGGLKVRVARGLGQSHERRLRTAYCTAGRRPHRERRTSGTRSWAALHQQRRAH